MNLTLLCISPLSLRPGVAGVCSGVPLCELLCLVGLCHVISGILAGGIPGFRMVLCCFTHSLVWPCGLGVFVWFCCTAILWGPQYHTEMIQSYHLLRQFTAFTHELVSVTLLLCSCGLVFCFVFWLGCVLLVFCLFCVLVFCVSLCVSVMTL